MLRQGGKSTSFVTGNRKTVHTTFNDGSELVEEYDVKTDELGAVFGAKGRGGNLSKAMLKDFGVKFGPSGVAESDAEDENGEQDDDVEQEAWVGVASEAVDDEGGGRGAAGAVG